MVTGVELDAVVSQLERAIHDVDDPELPHVTIGDLGMVESVQADPAAKTAVIDIIPTYTGCPATEQIADDVRAAATAAGWDVEVVIGLVPAWSTDRITERGRQRLLAAGIAPPQATSSDVTVVSPVSCPRCGSLRTRRVAEFGSTACKASYQCGACAEPFDYFKPF